MKVKKSPKAEYIRLNLSDLTNALNKTFKISIAPYGYGDDIHVFEAIKARKKIEEHSVATILGEREAAQEIFQPFEDSRSISSGDVEWLLMAAVSCGLLEGRNFIVDMQY